MANICVNELEFIGTRKRVQELLDLVKSDESDFDFNKIIPMPESLNIEESTHTDEALFFYVMAVDPANPPVGEINKLRQEEFDILLQAGLTRAEYHPELARKVLTLDPDQYEEYIALGKTAAYNLVNYGSISWYGWANEHWGSKWNADEVGVYGNTASFQTPWGPPEAIIVELSRLFPDIKIECSFDIEGAGYFFEEYQDGEITYEDVVGEEDEDDWDDEEDDFGARYDVAYKKFSDRVKMLRQQQNIEDTKDLPYDEISSVTVSGRTFVLTGQFEGFEDEKRDEITKRIMDKGGRCTRAVSGKTDYVVVGALGGFGEKKIEDVETQRAKGSNIKLIRQSDLFDALNGKTEVADQKKVVPVAEKAEKTWKEQQEQTKAAQEKAAIASAERKISYDLESNNMADFEIENGVLIKYRGSGGDVAVPDGVTSIGDEAFRDCSSLVSIELPESVTSIGYRAFDKCRSLANIKLPAGLTSIGKRAFNRCSSLVSIELPVRLTSIEYETFKYCSSLASIELPKNVTSIGDSAFSGCFSLASIVLPAGLTSIGNGTFYACSSLVNIELPAGVTSIGRETFKCSSLASIELPAGLASIGDEAFYGCKGLKSIVIPAGVTSIGDEAFEKCSRMKSITLPERLMSIELPAGVTRIKALEPQCSKAVPTADDAEKLRKEQEEQAKAAQEKAERVRVERDEDEDRKIDLSEFADENGNISFPIDDLPIEVLTEVVNVLEPGEIQTELLLAVGKRYYNGIGVEQNKQKAIEWMTKAAEQGSDEAQFALGGLYYIGKDVEEDKEKAIKWFGKAAEQGNANAQFYLGAMYWDGEGLEKDEKKGIEWLRKAAEQGNESAKNALDEILSEQAGDADEKSENINKPSSPSNHIESNKSAEQEGEALLIAIRSETQSLKQDFEKRATAQAKALENSSYSGVSDPRLMKTMEYIVNAFGAESERLLNENLQKYEQIKCSLSEKTASSIADALLELIATVDENKAVENDIGFVNRYSWKTDINTIKASLQAVRQSQPQTTSSPAVQKNRKTESADQKKVVSVAEKVEKTWKEQQEQTKAAQEKAAIASAKRNISYDLENNWNCDMPELKWTEGRVVGLDPMKLTRLISCRCLGDFRVAIEWDGLQYRYGDSNFNSSLFMEFDKSIIASDPNMNDALLWTDVRRYGNVMNRTMERLEKDKRLYVPAEKVHPGIQRLIAMLIQGCAKNAAFNGGIVSDASTDRLPITGGILYLMFDYRELFLREADNTYYVYVNGELALRLPTYAELVYDMIGDLREYSGKSGSYHVIYAVFSPEIEVSPGSRFLKTNLSDYEDLRSLMDDYRNAARVHRGTSSGNPSASPAQVMIGDARGPFLVEWDASATKEADDGKAERVRAAQEKAEREKAEQEKTKRDKREQKKAEQEETIKRKKAQIERQINQISDKIMTYEQEKAQKVEKLHSLGLFKRSEKKRLRTEIKDLQSSIKKANSELADLKVLSSAEPVKFDSGPIPENQKEIVKNIRSVLSGEAKTVAEINAEMGTDYTALQIADAMSYIENVYRMKVTRGYVNIKGKRETREYTAYFVKSLK